MANGIFNVRPGDVISSDLMNSILERMNELDERVTELELGFDESNVKIVSFSPTHQQEVGRALSVSGSNYVVPVDQNIVKIGDVSVVEFFGTSSPTQIDLRIPPIQGLPVAGDDLVVEVSNVNGVDRRLYRILPPVPVAGDPPVISSVVNDDNSGQPLMWNQFIKINGSNFADNSAENNIGFIFSGTKLNSNELDVAGSDANRIRLRLPMFEFPVLQTVAVEIILRVGAHPDVHETVNVFRPPA